MGTVIDGSEIDIFDCVASDLNEAAGEECNYYSINKEKSDIDMLYGEFSSRKHDGPWRLPSTRRVGRPHLPVCVVQDASG